MYKKEQKKSLMDCNLCAGHDSNNKEVEISELLFGANQ